MIEENGSISQLEIFLNQENTEKVWLLFAIRDNVDVNNMEMNITLNGNNLNPTTDEFNEIYNVEINSSWESKIIDTDRIEDVGYAVELKNLSVGFHTITLTLSEQGTPWVNISEEYVWTIRVLDA